MTLEIRQNEEFQKTESRLERVGWVILTAFIVAGLIGLVGAGPLSSRTASSENGVVSIDYDNVIHHEADTAVSLMFGPGAVDDGTITVALSGDWVSAVDLQGISPEPSEQRVMPDGMVLELPVAEAGKTEVMLTFRAQEYGPLSLVAEVGLDSVHVSQFVLP